MPVTLSNPLGVHTPGAYSHAALVSGTGQRLVLSGQIGVLPDGTGVEDPAAQIAQALANIGTTLAAHGMPPANLVKMTVFLTDPSLIPAWRAARGAWLGTHRPAST